MKVSPRVKLLALFAIFAAPIVASLLTYRFYKPEATSNYGELLAPKAVVDVPLARTTGATFRFADLAGKWVLVASDSGACAAACEAKLAILSQVRLALGRDASRVERVFVVDDAVAPRPDLAQAHPGLVVALTPAGAVLPQVPAHDRAHVYLLDPRGNVMMRYPATADRPGLLRDLKRLLRASQMG